MVLELRRRESRKRLDVGMRFCRVSVTRWQGKSKNPEKTCKKGLTSGEECGILSELQESGTARSAKAGRTKKLEKSLKNLLTNERQSGIINKLRAARQCSEKHSSLKIEQQDSCILMTKVQRLRKFF